MDCVLAGLMGDHLALIVDRLLTESTLEAAIGGGKRMVDLHQETVAVEYCHRALGGGSATKVECRICQEEDWDTCMEAPCACCGSLKVVVLFNHAIFILGQNKCSWLCSRFMIVLW